MIRDQEIERLVKYAEGLGVKVRFRRPKDPDDSAEWTLDGKEITIFINRGKNKTKTEIILSLVHELGHQLDHIHENNREVDEEFEEALTPNEDGEINKRKRRKILNSEIAGTAYWLTIYKDTNLKIPLYKLYAAMEHDLWQYETYYETGEFPGSRARRSKGKEIYAKHRKINYE